MSKQNIVKPRIPSGVMELLPREQACFQRMLDTIRETYESFGFQGLDTTTMELTKVLLTKSGGDTEKQVYFVQSTGSLKQGYDPDMALRFDLTVPLARYVAQNERNLPFPFRRYQIAKVYRGESAQAGRYREFYQCDIDVVGREKLSLTADAEMPAIISALFRKLNIGSFTIKMSNRKILQGLLVSLGLEEAEKRTVVVRLIDKADKVGLDKVLEDLRSLEELTLSEEAVNSIKAFLEINGDARQVLAGLEELGIENEEYKTGVAEMTEVIDNLEAMGVPKEDYVVDTSIARGLDYYTGTVYETFLDDYKKLGSICSGGRYENLTAFYSKAKLPGVGISIGATRLFYQLNKAGLLGNPRSSVDVMFAELSTDLRGKCFELANELRSVGIKTCVWTEGTKFKKQMTYADKAGIPFVIFIGEDEIAKNQARVKDMQNGEQADVPLDNLASYLQMKFTQH